MDGLTLTAQLQQLLQEPSNSTWIDQRSSYDYLYQAVVKFVERTHVVTATQTITTDSTFNNNYQLNSDFLRLYMMDRYDRLFIRYTQNGQTLPQFIYWRDYMGIVYENDQTLQADVPLNFSIINQNVGTLTAQLSSTATSTVSQFHGESVLQDTTAHFKTPVQANATSPVSVYDTVHNVTDGSHGVVLSVDSDTQLTCALFNGVLNAFTTGDSYIVNPQARFTMVLDQASLNSGDTILVDYVQRPTPVYSPYRSYNMIMPQYQDAIVQYAAFLYKYRDREPNFGDGWYKVFDACVRQAARANNQALNKRRLRFNGIQRTYTDSSYI
jgi:hypothetical protein